VATVERAVGPTGPTTRRSSEERLRVLDALAVRMPDYWRVRFAFMLGLSVVIAGKGLAADSAAVVIGAMLIAPLMTPVLAVAACLSMGWIRLGLRSAFTVVLASMASIALAWLLSRLVPNGGLTGEELARTGPALTDLLVALAAGLAGGYATVRTDVSSSLPGVAVAVALVPPLATVGITLQNGRTDLAKGALLLYVVNLLAIVLAGMAVFIATGFVPSRRLTQFRGRVGLAVVATFIALVVAAAPLAAATDSAISRARTTQRVNTVATTWLERRDLEVTSVDVSDDRANRCGRTRRTTVDCGAAIAAGTVPGAEHGGRGAMDPAKRSFGPILESVRHHTGRPEARRNRRCGPSVAGHRRSRGRLHDLEYRDE
jgi:uncharacterized hydrophobic protein (TIGR00271 family)